MLQAVSSLAHLLHLLPAYFCHYTVTVVHLGLDVLALKDFLWVGISLLLQVNEPERCPIQAK
jgi:hypothetical protein